MKLEIYKFTWTDVMNDAVMYKYYMISDNRLIAQCGMINQNSCDSIGTGKLLEFFEDHINEMFDLSDKPIIDVSRNIYLNPEKLCELTYTESEMKQLRVNKKIEEINKDFED